jgi:hypothetical protein
LQPFCFYKPICCSLLPYKALGNPLIHSYPELFYGGLNSRFLELEVNNQGSEKNEASITHIKDCDLSGFDQASSFVSVCNIDNAFEQGTGKDFLSEIMRLAQEHGENIFTGWEQEHNGSEPGDVYRSITLVATSKNGTALFDDLLEKDAKEYNAYISQVGIEELKETKAAAQVDTLMEAIDQKNKLDGFSL